MRDLRLQRGLSQAQLADDRLTAGYVSLIEAGKRTPTARTIAYLAERLGCSVHFLTEGTDSEADREDRLLAAYAELSLASGEADEAERTFARLLRTTRSADVRASAEWGQARALEAQGRLEQAIAGYERLLANTRTSDGREQVVTVVIALARCYREVGDFAHSVEIAEAALDRLTTAGLSGTDLEVQLACTLAAAYTERGDLTKATNVARQTIDRAERAGSPRARGSAYWNASVIAHEAGRRTEALSLAERALALFGENDDERNLARLRNAYAGLMLRVEQPRVEPAMEQLLRAWDALSDSGSAVDLAYCETEIARAYLVAGEPGKAVEVAQTALGRLHGGERIERLRSQAVLLHALFADGATDRAEELMNELVTELELIGTGRASAVLWREVGDAARAAGKLDVALHAYEQSLAVAGILGATTAGDRVAINVVAVD
jgi:tetratricopeptide (TPR) repeat protein